MALLRLNANAFPRRLRHALCALLAVCTFAAPVGVAEPIARQLDIEAVFLINLTRFVRWPDQVFATEDTPLVIGVMPNDPIAGVLTEAARGETAGSHPITLRWIRTTADVGACQLVYFSKSNLNESAQMVAALREKPVLLVSDADGFLRLGGQVQLYKRGAQVRLRIDLANLRRSHLNADTTLLRVAELVHR